MLIAPNVYRTCRVSDSEFFVNVSYVSKSITREL